MTTDAPEAEPFSGNFWSCFQWLGFAMAETEDDEFEEEARQSLRLVANVIRRGHATLEDVNEIHAWNRQLIELACERDREFRETCDHEWVDATNEVVASGEMCPKCGSVRASQNTAKTAK